MKNKLYNSEIEPACEYCKHGKINASGDRILCLKKGVMPLYAHCSHYKYNPLKRKPKPKPVLQTHDAAEFEL